MNLAFEEVLVILAALGLLLLLVWGNTLLGAIVTFHEWLGKKLEEMRHKRERTDGGDE